MRNLSSMFSVCAPTVGIFPHSAYFLQSFLSISGERDYTIIAPTDKDFSLSGINVITFRLDKIPPKLKVIYSTAFCLAKSSRRALVLDGHFFTCFFWSVLSKKSIYLTCTEGPEYYKQRRQFFAIFQFLKRVGKRNFFLIPRTEQLETAWKAFQIQTCSYKTWELRKDLFLETKKLSRDFALVGQFRKEKNANEIYDILRDRVLFAGIPAPGYITNFRYVRFPKEHELIMLINSSKFLICLYSNWDSRKESGLFFQSLMSLTPVIAYDDGWLGDVINKSGVGYVYKREKSLEEIFHSELLRSNDLYEEKIIAIKEVREKMYHESKSYVNKDFLSKTFV